MFPFLSPDGTISSSSILLAQSLQHCVHSQNCSATDLFYQGSSQTVREWLNVAITRTLHQGEESLLELTKQICSFLQVKVQSSDVPELGLQVLIGNLTGWLKMTLSWCFPGGSLVKNLPTNAGDVGLIPDLERFHVPWSS